MINKEIMINDEILAAFMEGNVNANEVQAVLNGLASDSHLREIFEVASRVDEALEETNLAATQITYPITSLAADSEDYLCDVECEQYILSTRGIDISKKQMSCEAIENCWLKEKGMPLHHIGRMLESNNITVARSFAKSITDIHKELRSMSDVIVVVNKAKLYDKELKDINPNHAIVVLDINESLDLIRVFNPGSAKLKEVYTISEFEKAWSDSNKYMAVAKPSDGDYLPMPLDTSDVTLNSSFIELRESIAENAHENWAKLRMSEGWTYGPTRSDALKQTPDMVPYSKLPESEKDYDRELAMETIKLVNKLGYEIVKKGDSPAYSMLVRRLLSLEEEKCTCPNCNNPIFRSQLYCEQCGKKLDNEDFRN